MNFSLAEAPSATDHKGWSWACTADFQSSRVVPLVALMKTAEI